MRTTRRAAPALVTAAAATGTAAAQDTVFELGKLNEIITVIGEAADAATTDNDVLAKALGLS